MPYARVCKPPPTFYCLACLCEGNFRISRLLGEVAGPEITLRQPERTPSLEQISCCAFLPFAPAFCDVALLACVHDGDLSMMLIPKAPDDISGFV